MLASSLFGDRLGVAARKDAEQDHFEQFVVRHGNGAAVAKALAQALAVAGLSSIGCGASNDGALARLLVRDSAACLGACLAAPSARAAALRPDQAALVSLIRRAIEPAGEEVKISQPVVGHADGMLELGREFAVARHRRPAVGQDFHVRLAEVDHRLDGEQHAGFEHDAFARARRSATCSGGRGRRGRGRGRRNRATTLQRSASAYFWIAAPMSPVVSPGFTAAMPRISDS